MADEQINPLVKLIQERLPWLFSECGFKIVSYSYDARAFGNCLVLLESESLRLRFERDRGFATSQLASQSDPERWYELGFLLMSVGGERPDVGFEGNAALLTSNWPALLQALGPKLPQTRQEYERREQISRETLERFTNRLPVTPQSFVKNLKRTRTGRNLLYLLRLAELGILLLALYAIFNYKN